MTSKEVFINAIQARKKVAITFSPMDNGNIDMLVCVPLSFGPKANGYYKDPNFYRCLVTTYHPPEIIHLGEKQVRHIKTLDEISDPYELEIYDREALSWKPKE
jgi:hypothetical protein